MKKTYEELIEMLRERLNRWLEYPVTRIYTKQELINTISIYSDLLQDAYNREKNQKKGSDEE